MHQPPLRPLASLFLIALLSACSTTHFQSETLARPRETPGILLMPLDVELSEVNAGGVAEPKADWTDQARGNMTAALRDIMAGRRANVVVFDDNRLSPEDGALTTQLMKLHEAVGMSIRAHKVGLFPLPTKQGKFDWSLGPDVAVLRRNFDADYALFVFMRDSYSSAGRVMVIAAAALLGVGIPGGQQIGFASLVDLRSGDVTWFHLHARGTGDLRTTEPARETTTALLEQFPK
ncbi:MAG: hypothetical protein Q7R40_03550 [Phaeospirillum sp.]|nr:hypothetical protein [Phaeospirillum sp.]